MIKETYFRKRTVFYRSNEDLLLEKGLVAFSQEQKESLIDLLATKFNITHLDVTDEFILNHHKLLKVALLKKTCEEEIEKGFLASNGHFYRTNRDDQINMIGQKDELNADPAISNVPWKTEDVDYIMHTKEEWLIVYNEAFAHKKEQLFKYSRLKNLVMNATTDEEIVSTRWVEAEERII